MNELNKIQTAVYYLGGLLLVVGAVIYLVPALTLYAPWVFTLGAVCFASMQLLARYDGQNYVIRRLRRQQIIGALLLVVTGFVMYMNIHNIRPFRGTEWLMFFMIAVVFQVYAAFRIPAELEKEKR